MLRIMKNRQTPIKQSKSFVIIVAAAFIAIVLSGFIGYRLAYQKYNPKNTAAENKPGYITSDAARSQVENFYQQYLNPKKETPEESRKVYISSYGDKNLTFYNQYYQHGFDPIVCSPVMPTSITVASVVPGPGATVTARAKYPDGSTSDINVTLVINAEGFKIDSITCSGDKGNLPPSI